MTLADLIEQWRSENRAHCMEGVTGVRNLEKLCGVIGYKEGDFIGSEVALMNFLADNSGAIDALLEWMGETENEEWAYDIKSELRRKMMRLDNHGR